MAYNYEYPYVDANRYNADWILEQISAINTRLDTIKEGILEEAEAYTDAQITAKLADVTAQYEAFKAEVEAELSTMDSKYDAFVKLVNAQLTLTDAKLAKMQDTVNSVLSQANAYTNLAISANNAYIVDQTTKALSTVTVLNYFTGARVSIQEMFDYLAKFHLTNAISVQTLVNRAKDVDTLINLNMTMTDLATNGGTIITP